MHKFRFTFLFTLTLLCSLLVFWTPNTIANTNTHFATSQCDIQVRGSMAFTDEIMTITDTRGDTLRIDANQQVEFNDEPLTLSPAQRILFEQYYYNIKAAIPMGVEMAAQGLELANVAVNDILSQLLGADDPMIIKLNELLMGIAVGLQNDIYDAEGNLSLAPQSPTNQNWFSPEWQTAFNQTLSDTIEENMGRLLLAIGSELLFGDGELGFGALDPDALAMQVEQKIAVHADELGRAAMTLCDIVAAAETAETELSQSLPELAKWNFVHYQPGYQTAPKFDNQP